MEEKLTSSIPIDSNTDIEEAREAVLGGLEAEARAHGLAPGEDEVEISTTFGVVQEDSGQELLQGTLATEVDPDDD